MNEFKSPKDTLEELSKDIPKNRSPIKAIIFSIIGIVAVIWFVSNSFKIIEPNQPTTEEAIAKTHIFYPGMHFVNKYPFMIKVKLQTIKVGYDYKWYWELYEKPAVLIPQNYFGIVLEDEKLIEIIPPGKHYINTVKYEVRLTKPDELPRPYFKSEK